MKSLYCDGCRKVASVNERAALRVEVLDPAASRDSRAFATLYTENGWTESANGDPADGDPADGTVLCYVCRLASPYTYLDVCRECDALIKDDAPEEVRAAGFCSHDCQSVHGGGRCPDCGEAMDAHDMRQVNERGGVGVCPAPIEEEDDARPGVRAEPMSGGYYAVTRDAKGGGRETAAAWYMPEQAWWLVDQLTKEANGAGPVFSL